MLWREQLAGNHMVSTGRTSTDTDEIVCPAEATFHVDFHNHRTRHDSLDRVAFVAIQIRRRALVAELLKTEMSSKKSAQKWSLSSSATELPFSCTMHNAVLQRFGCALPTGSRQPTVCQNSKLNTLLGILLAPGAERVGILSGGTGEKRGTVNQAQA